MNPAVAATSAEAGRIRALIEIRDRYLTAIRFFFHQRGYREVITPVLVHCPGLDRHIEAIAAGDRMFLATSPELHMKRLVCHGARRIYQITPAFRADELGPHHRAEFLMLEWYRAGIGYIEMMQETEDLIRHVSAACDRIPLCADVPFQRLSVDKLYEETAGWKPSVYWDEERYFQDWVDIIEPYLQSIPAVIVYDFPAELAALSRLSPLTNRICERFELFLNGLEICNAYSELTDPYEHHRRFELSARHRASMGRPSYKKDEIFLKYVEQGMPECAGNALGIDRLIMALTGAGHIKDVSLFPEDAG